MSETVAPGRARGPGRADAPAPIRTTFDSAWAYARHELLYLFWALMEAALIAPLALLLLPWARFWPAPLFTAWLLLVMLIPFNLSRVLTLAGASLRRQRRVMLGALLLTVLVSLRTLLFDAGGPLDTRWLGELYGHFVQPDNPFWQRDVGLFFLVIGVWWRGISLTGRRVDVRDVGLRLRAGGLLFAPLLLLLSLLPEATPSTSFVLLFFLAALTSVALTRAESVTLEHTGQSYAMRPGWVLIVFLTSLLIVSLAAAVALAIGGGGFPALLRWLHPLWDAIFFLAMVVIVTTTYLFLLLLRPLQWLVSYLFSLLGFLGVEGLPEPEELPQELTDMNVDQITELFRDGGGLPLFWINRALTVLLVAGALFVVWLALNRYFRRRELARGHEAILGGRAAAEESGLGLGERIRRRLGLWRQMRAAANVRHLYRQMSEAAAARGFPRHSSQTPYEYLGALDDVWPDGQEETRLITTAYVRVRYGEVPETEEEMAQLRSAWRRLAHMEPPPPGA
ncbi:MAG: DUF4129 domain-containing protein [Chloroflexota bacterium]